MADTVIVKKLGEKYNLSHMNLSSPAACKKDVRGQGKLALFFIYLIIFFLGFMKL